MNPNIQKVHVQDLPKLHEIALASKMYWDYPPAWLDHWREGLRLQEKDLKTQKIYKLEIAGMIIGYCAIQAQDDFYEITNLWILPAYIGKGYGKFLLDAAIQKVVPDGQTIVVEADPNAEAFYAKQGFVTFDKKESYPKGRFLPVMKR